MTDLRCYTIECEQGTFLVCLYGEIDIATRQDLREVVEAYAASLPCDVVIDLAAVSFLDTTGLVFLVTLDRVVREHGHTLTLRHVPPAVRRALQIVGLGRFLPEEAIRPR
jgi:anti-sigma B factor antagonist